MWLPFATTSQLCLPFTLTNGQCFGWRRVGDAFVGVLGHRVLSLRENGDRVEALEHATEGSADSAAGIEGSSAAGAAQSSSSATSDATGSSAPPPTGTGTGAGAERTPLQIALEDYFQLAVDLSSLYSLWSRADPRMSLLTTHLPSMRVLRQDPWECLLSFICSSNNNIPRIIGMLDKIREAYGQQLAVVDGRPYYSFPTPATLAEAEEGALRALGCGYRAKYIKAAAARVRDMGGQQALLTLRSRPLEEVRAALQQFEGVGPKVADCVALFSCDQPAGIPVDTHVWAIACCYYDKEGTLAACKSLTPTVYDRVGSIFRSRYGSHAGWAHCLLFAAELPTYRALLPPGLGEEMQAFRAKEKEAKAVKKAAAQERKRARESQSQEGLGETAGGGEGQGQGEGGSVLDTSYASTFDQGDEEADGQEET